nr:MAG TPA: hypothetical protein [Caudoviricetes sp.]
MTILKEKNIDCPVVSVIVKRSQGTKALVLG